MKKIIAFIIIMSILPSSFGYTVNNEVNINVCFNDDGYKLEVINDADVNLSNVELNIHPNGVDSNSSFAVVLPILDNNSSGVIISIPRPETLWIDIEVDRMTSVNLIECDRIESSDYGYIVEHKGQAIGDTLSSKVSHMFQRDRIEIEFKDGVLCLTKADLAEYKSKAPNHEYVITDWPKCDL